MKIEIPITPVTLVILTGKNGLKKFTTEVQKKNKEWKPIENAGYSYENYIWLSKYDKKTLLHELIHFLDWLYKYLSCEEEREFKAFLGEFVISEALERFCK